MLLDIIGACTWPAARDLGSFRNILWANSFFWVFVHFSRGSSFWVFFVFWVLKAKEILWLFVFSGSVFGNVEGPWNSCWFLLSGPPWVHRCSKDPLQNQGTFFVFIFFMTYILFRFLDTLLDFLDIYIYTWHELRKVEISKW